MDISELFNIEADEEEESGQEEDVENLDGVFSILRPSLH